MWATCLRICGIWLLSVYSAARQHCLQYAPIVGQGAQCYSMHLHKGPGLQASVLVLFEVVELLGDRVDEF